jgi:general secretion pathway protein G
MKKSTSGFTIVELIIVVVVISILAAIIIVSFNASQQKARNATRLTDLKLMQDAVETYRAQNGTYPSTTNAWRGRCSVPTVAVSTSVYIPSIAAGGYYEGGSSLPLDPKWKLASDNKCYMYRSDGVDYMIVAYLTAEGLCGTNGDPGDSCNSDEIRAFDRPNVSEPSFAVYSNLTNITTKGW